MVRKVPFKLTSEGQGLPSEDLERKVAGREDIKRKDAERVDTGKFNEQRQTQSVRSRVLASEPQYR